VRTEVQLGQVHAYRYASPAQPPRYHPLIAHGIGGHGGTCDVFCEPMTARGVTVHSIDLPGHGLARNLSGEFRFTDWLEDIDEAARLIKQESSHPVFVLGSSQVSAAAFHSLAFSPAVDGAVTMGIILSTVPSDGGPKELSILPGAGHRLMLYYTDAYLDIVDSWASRQAETLAPAAGAPRS
jgi:alpha-beta hydrolase superfamily lysophospholipase